MLEHLKEKKDVKFFSSLAGLMAQCRSVLESITDVSMFEGQIIFSVLDLDVYERCIKAENLGSVTESSAGKMVLTTVKAFRIIISRCNSFSMCPAQIAVVSYTVPFLIFASFSCHFIRYCQHLYCR